MSYYEDKDLQCMKCGAEFIWTGGEQRFMNNLLEDGKIEKVMEPRSCEECRLKRKQRFEN